MKRTLIYMFAAMSLVGSSCSGDWLNLNPSTSVTTPQAIRTLEEAQIALNGIYRIAASHSYYGDNYLYYADCVVKMFKHVSAREPENVYHLIMSSMSRQMMP